MSRSKRRQFVLLGSSAKPDDASGEPLGSLKEVRAVLASHNTSPDGSPPSMGMLRFYGPGMTMEISTSNDTITQAIVSVNDEPIAWPVLSKMCSTRRWRLMDVESGRVMSW